MPGSSNIVQWNPAAANQETDAQYLADSMRSGGATDPSIFASILANKAFYQWSTVIAALAQMMANKGYTISDANLPNLVNALSNILTNADLLNSLALGGNPTVPSQLSSDNSGRIANTNTVHSILANSPALGGAPTCPTPATTDNSPTVTNTGWVYGSSAHASSGVGGTYIKLPAWLGGFIIQFGLLSTGGVSPATGTLPLAFPSQWLSAHATPAATGGSTVSMFVPSLSTFQLQATAMPISVWWLAFGV